MSISQILNFFNDQSALLNIMCLAVRILFLILIYFVYRSIQSKKSITHSIFYMGFTSIIIYLFGKNHYLDAEKMGPHINLILEDIISEGIK